MKHSYWVGLLILLSGMACVAEQEKLEDRATEQVATTQTAVSITPFLLSVEDVKGRLANGGNFVIFEISKKYNQEHLPGAFHLWRPDYENNSDFPYEGMMATRLQMERLLSQHGVIDSTEIIIYDTKGSADAMRLLWILRSYGHHKAAVMDGGKTAWQQAQYPLSQGPLPAPVPSDYHFPGPVSSLQMASMKDVLAALTDTNIIIIDTREPEEFMGKPYLQQDELLYYKKGAFASGAIPGAIHINWSDAVDLDGNHCFKSLHALQYNFTKKGISPDKQIITYCQSGVRSAHTTFVLTELLGYPNVRNYDGSWIEWSYFYQNGQKVPIEQHTPLAEVTQESERLAAKLLEKQN
jgi:thiosulfate/3-mercaptopyruvate sulfurtransferase